MFCYGAIDNLKDQGNILKDIFRLRYQVYVKEWHFENAEDHPHGLEMDEFDRHSAHFFAQDPFHPGVIATARIILASAQGFPIERYFDIKNALLGLDKERIGEVSRLAVSKEYRKRSIDRAIFGTGNYDPKHIPRYVDSGRDFRRQCEHELVRGLYLCIYRDSKQRGLEFWYAVMSKGLHIILRRWGIPFVQVGPTVDYHGLRAPYLVSIQDVERSLEKNNPDLLRDARNPFLH